MPIAEEKRGAIGPKTKELAAASESEQTMDGSAGGPAARRAAAKPGWVPAALVGKLAANRLGP